MNLTKELRVFINEDRLVAHSADSLPPERVYAQALRMLPVVIKRININGCDDSKESIAEADSAVEKYFMPIEGAYSIGLAMVTLYNEAMDFVLKVEGEDCEWEERMIFVLYVKLKILIKYGEEFSTSWEKVRERVNEAVKGFIKDFANKKLSSRDINKRLGEMLNAMDFQTVVGVTEMLCRELLKSYPTVDACRRELLNILNNWVASDSKFPDLPELFKAWCHSSNILYLEARANG